jgi:hypothetical protein
VSVISVEVIGLSLTDKNGKKIVLDAKIAPELFKKLNKIFAWKGESSHSNKRKQRKKACQTTRKVSPKK